MSESITKELMQYVWSCPPEDISGRVGIVIFDIAGRIDARFTRKLEDKQAEIDALKSDNADLQARLDASIQPPVDADGVPCKPGDLMETDEHIPRKVVGYYLADESTPCVTLNFVSPSIEASRLHHVVTEPPEPPDSQERIDADAKKDACEYFGNGIGHGSHGFSCDGCQASGTAAPCNQTMCRDLLRRQRELDEAGEQR